MSFIEMRSTFLHVRAGIGRARQQGEQRQRDGHDPQHVEWPDHHGYP